MRFCLTITACSSYLKALAPWLLLAAFALTCFASQREKSITVDEFCHFPSGIYNLVSLDWRMNRESPPLIKCVPALTAIITKPNLNVKGFQRDPNPWRFGYDFMFRNHDKYQHILGFGRYVVILLGCFGGLVLYKFAREIYGYKGGLFALFLYVFNPNILAHSRLTTIDIGATGMMLLSIYCFWRFLRQPDKRWAFMAGIALGVAQLSKFTALILYPIFLLIFATSICKKAFWAGNRSMGNGKTFLLRNIGCFALTVAVSVFVINGGYLFSGTLIPLNEYTFLSKPLQQLSSLCWQSLPIPLPCDYIGGFDSQLAISAGNNPFYAGYLMGERSLTGWWYYYAIAFAVKNPVALWVILMLTVFAWIRGKADRPDFETGLCIWVPIVVFFAYFSFFTHTPIGIRFLLPIFPLLFLAAGYLCHASLIQRKVARFVVVVVAIGYLIPAAAIFPNYLSYFNLASGGPQNGHRWLLDSNLDMGQDLPGLKKYMEQNGIKKINLGYFGRVDPKLYGIDYTLAEQEVGSGVCAISVNFLVGRPYYLLQEDPRGLLYIDSDYFKNYRTLEPSKIIGHTLHIFDVDHRRPKANQRHKMS